MKFLLSDFSFIINDYVHKSVFCITYFLFTCEIALIPSSKLLANLLSSVVFVNMLVCKPNVFLVQIKTMTKAMQIEFSIIVC